MSKTSPFSTASKIAAFPQEIHDEIMDLLHKEPPALQNCALVCRAWLSRAQHHLFHDIALDPSPRSRHFTKLVQGRPEIQSLVRHLELCGRASTSKAWWEGGPSLNVLAWPTLGPANANLAIAPIRRGHDATDLLSWLREIFALEHAPTVSGGVTLPKVHTLRLAEFMLNGDIVAFMARAFPHVGTLSLNGCRAMSFADLVGLLQAFPHLHTLRLLSAEWLPSRPGDHLPGATGLSTEGVLPGLRHLELSRDIYTEPLLQWFVKIGAHRRIRSFRCSIWTHQGATAMCSFLHASGPFLEFLSVTLSESRDPTAILDGAQLDLSPCTALRTLQIRCSPPRSMLMQRSLSWVLILLSKMRSTHLREIRLCIKAPELLSLNLEGLDVVLAQNKVNQLRDLTFEVDDSAIGGRKQGRELVEGMLRARLPTANAQQLIRLEYSG